MSPPLSEKFSSSMNTLPQQSAYFVKATIDQISTPQKPCNSNLEFFDPTRLDALHPYDEQENGRGSERVDTVPKGEGQDISNPVYVASYGSSTDTILGAVVRQRQSPRKVSSPEKRFPIKTSTSSSFSVGISPKKLVGHVRAVSKPLIGQDQMDTGGSLSNAADPAQEACDFADETAFSTFSIVTDVAILSDFKQDPIDKTSSNMPFRDKPDAKSFTSWKELTSQEKSLSDGRAAHASGRLALVDLVDNGCKVDHAGLESQTFFTRSGQTPASKTLSDHSFDGRAELHSGTMCMECLYSSVVDDSSHISDPERSCKSESHHRRKSAVVRGDLKDTEALFLSQISNLKVNIEEKQAEVRALGVVISEAARKAKHASRELQEQHAINEKFLVEKEHWNKKSRQMEQQMHDIKEAMLKNEREKFEIQGRLEESEQRREAAEIMAQEAESKAAGLRMSCNKTCETRITDDKKDSSSTSSAVQVAVEKVARELHLLYKNKHESKVAALKRSYESRWERKVGDLETKVTALTLANEELKTRVDDAPSAIGSEVVDKMRTEETTNVYAEESGEGPTSDTRERSSLEVLECLRNDNAELRKQLELERMEKGELVMACDELLALQDRVQAQSLHPGVGRESRKGVTARMSGLMIPELSSTNQSGMGVTASSRIAKLERVRITSS